MAKRRANGEGSIRKRSDGRWEGRYTVGYNPETGKQKFKNVLGKTQTEVKEKLKAAIVLLFLFKFKMYVSIQLTIYTIEKRQKCPLFLMMKNIKILLSPILIIVIKMKNL